MTTISDGETTSHPILWMQYRSTRQAATRTHPLEGGGIVMTLAPAQPREVTLVLLFADEQAAMDCENMHARDTVLNITETGRPTHSMQYVVTGTIGRELDEETADMWIVSAEVMEVAGPQ